MQVMTWDDHDIFDGEQHSNPTLHRALCIDYTAACGQLPACATAIALGTLCSLPGWQSVTQAACYTSKCLLTQHLRRPLKLALHTAVEGEAAHAEVGVCKCPAFLLCRMG